VKRVSEVQIWIYCKLNSTDKQLN